MHPLADIIHEAMHGRFPPSDGRVETLTPWRTGVEAAVAMTGHGYLCLDAGHGVPAAVADLAADACGGVADPRVVSALAGATAGRLDIDSLDLVVVAPARPRVADDPTLIESIESPENDHPRAVFARRLREDVRVFTSPGIDGVLVVATGLAGLTEISIELSDGHRGHGGGAALLAAARSLAPVGDPVVAAVAPGNAASLRALLNAGFAPIGSVQIWHRPAS